MYVYVYAYIFYMWGVLLALAISAPWDSLAMTFTGKFVFMTHHFILLQLSPFGLRVDGERWWFEHSMS